jgi:hypothetical protein
MSRSNTDKPFYVDVGTSIVAVRCASNHDVVLEYDHSRHPFVIELAEKACDRMNKEAEIGRPRRNCDVGTATEQKERYDRYCSCHGSNTTCSDSTFLCGDCPLLDQKAECEFAWAQMPYEEGGNNGQ